MNAHQTKWQAVVQWTSEGQARQQTAHLIAVSPRAVRLIAPEQMPLHQECTIALTDVAGSVHQTVLATVHLLRWTESGNQLSFRLQAPLSGQLLERLRADGLYDRRERGRKQVKLQAPAWPELNSQSNPISVRVIDLSRGGCCVKSPVPVSVGNRLTLVAGKQQEGGDVVRLRVMWQQASGDEFLLGCAFLQEGDSAVLTELAESGPKGAGGLMHTVLSVGQLPVTAVLSALQSRPT